MRRWLGLALLLVAGPLCAATYYNQTTLTPLANANSIACNNTGSQAAWIDCTLSQIATMLYGNTLTLNQASTFTSATGNIAALELDQNPQNGAYTYQATDSGHEVFHSSSAHTHTIPCNGCGGGQVAFPVGTCIVATNDTASSGNLTVAITTDTLLWPSQSLSGSRTVAPGGSMTFCKKKSTTWWVISASLVSDLLKRLAPVWSDGPFDWRAVA